MNNKEKVVRILRKRGFPISLDDLVKQARVSERGVIAVCDMLYDHDLLVRVPPGCRHTVYFLSEKVWHAVCIFAFRF